jgi:hypothetical protein
LSGREQTLSPRLIQSLQENTLNLRGSGTQEIGHGPSQELFGRPVLPLEQPKKGMVKPHKFLLEIDQEKTVRPFGEIIGHNIGNRNQADVKVVEESRNPARRRSERGIKTVHQIQGGERFLCGETSNSAFQHAEILQAAKVEEFIQAAVRTQFSCQVVIPV